MKDLINNNPVLQIIIAVIFVSFFAQIEIILPINKDGIPITGQTFAVLLVGFFLGVKKGTLAMIVYIILGAIGLPIFAGGAGGINVLSDNSAGFIFGFVFGAALTGYFGEIGWGKSFMKCLLGMILGTLLVTIFGVLFLSTRYGLADALKYGFYPFIWGAVIKTVLGATIPPIYYNLIKDKR